MSCKNCNENTVKYLVEHGANIHKENKNGDTPLIKSCDCKWRNEDIIKHLIYYSGDVNKENKA